MRNKEKNLLQMARKPRDGDKVQGRESEKLASFI